MKWITESPNTKVMRAEIAEEEFINITENNKNEIGYYLYIFMKDGTNYDYLQDALEIAQEQALEQFGIPLSAWRQVE